MLADEVNLLLVLGFDVQYTAGRPFDFDGFEQELDGQQTRCLISYCLLELVLWKELAYRLTMVLMTDISRSNHLILMVLSGTWMSDRLDFW
jgi:hypothetical protein